MLDKGGAVKDFVDALQQLANPDMVFKVTGASDLSSGKREYLGVGFVSLRTGGTPSKMRWKKQLLIRQGWLNCLRSCFLISGIKTQVAKEYFTRNLFEYVVCSVHAFFGLSAVHH